MGSYRSKPDTEKERESGSNEKLEYWVCGMQGWRVTMEDTSLVQLDFSEETSLFCIFDGHGGDETAKFCQAHFGVELRKNQSFVAKRYPKALKETFLRMDELMRTDKGQEELRRYRGSKNQNPVCSGCTALVALVCKNCIYVANAGDCRALIIQSDGTVYQMNREHKPNMPEELARIVGAGSTVVKGRIDEILNLSRAIGDLEYKNNFLFEPEEQTISAVPDITSKSLDVNDAFLLMGCDGVYEKLPDCSMRDIILDAFEKGQNMSEALDQILDDTLAVRTVRTSAGLDNMTGILVKLRRN